MKAKNSFRILHRIALFAICLALPYISRAQCRTDVLLGQNIVTNGSFSQGYTAWTFTPDSDGNLATGPDGYKVFTSGFSVPGHIFVGTGADMSSFNGAFNKPFNGHTTGAANDNFLMVDGVCVTGIKLWRQTSIPVIPNTRYYFSVWINSLKDQPNYPGLLNFDVNGTDLATGIVAPLIGGGSTGGAWKKVEAFWDSGTTPPATVTISIEGNQTIGCGGVSGESDFAIDDVSFIPGCGYSDNGPQPNLGVDRTICGTGGSITLDANVPHTDSTLVTWSANAPGVNSGFGLTAPYSKIITAPGTYSVCVTAGNACTKSDIIVVTNTFTPNTTPNADLCITGGSAPLDAVFTGIGVTYQWKRGGINLPAPSTNRTYNATTIGVYTVDVSVPGCGTVTSGNTTITSSATATPTTSPSGNLCSTNPVPLDAVITGTGITYQWKLNGSNLPAPSTNRTYSALSVGNYTVDVKLPGCTTTTSATTTVTSSSPITPVNANYCANAGAVSGVTLGATGTNSANYKWYTALSGGAAINTGSSYVITPAIPMGTTGTQTYYVQDETVSNGTVGPTTFINGNSADGASAWNANYITITPGGDFTINSLEIPFIFYSGTPPAFNVTIEVADASGASFGTPKRFTSANTATPITIGSSKLYSFSFTGFDIKKIWGSTLTLKIFSNTSAGGQTFVSTSGYAGYPYASSASVPSVVNIINSKINGTTTTNGGYAYLFNMNISAATICSRIPVLAINNCPTPVTWTSFYLIPQDNNNCKLVWSTADETNNSYFAVERSIDGINFETIASLSGAGNRDIASNYFYVDSEPLSGTSYYRITQHDYDGKYSSTVMKPYSSLGLIEVTTYPNPFQNNTSLLVSGAYVETYTYTLYSVSGQLVEEGSGTINQVQTIAEKLAKGMYMLTVLTNTDIITTKIVKQ